MLLIIYLIILINYFMNMTSKEKRKMNKKEEKLKGKGRKSGWKDLDGM